MLTTISSLRTAMARLDTSTHSGNAAIIEDRSIIEIQDAIQRWIEVGEVIVQVIGP
ncbi:MAG TPA: hypothetical protein VK277_12340 [Acidimicrobiales bacterium]|nr:hypothetical protein [Acidimicrobiales bacterium]